MERLAYLLHKEQRNVRKWGTYGKFGSKNIKHVFIKNLSDTHIINILKSQSHIGNKYKILLLNELFLRVNEPEFSLTDEQTNY